MCKQPESEIYRDRYECDRCRFPANPHNLGETCRICGGVCIKVEAGEVQTKGVSRKENGEMSCTICDYCMLEAIRRRAGEVKRKVTILNVSYYQGSLGGVEVYTHPNEIEIEKLKGKNKEQYFKVWFGELPNHCCCCCDGGLL